MDKLLKAASLIKSAKHISAFTGAGISKESGIPVFRGDTGVYSKYDHNLLEIITYKNRTEESWEAIKAIFYDVFEEAKPNTAHFILAEWEKRGILKSIITQNIDNLHKESGSNNVVEYHGNKEYFICMSCESRFMQKEIKLAAKVLSCPKCKGLLKPDFVFFGEPIPKLAADKAHYEAEKSDLMIIIGTTGEVQPASYIPHHAKKSNAMIIEINPEPSKFTNIITDIFINMKASEALMKIDKLI